jgi:hypothetical protein
VAGGQFAPRTLTVVFIPRRHYRTGYAVRVTGARVVSRWGSPWLELQALPRARVVRVSVWRTAHGTTLTPLQVNRCGYDLVRCG